MAAADSSTARRMTVVAPLLGARAGKASQRGAGRWRVSGKTAIVTGTLASWGALCSWVIVRLPLPEGPEEAVDEAVEDCGPLEVDRVSGVFDVLDGGVR